MTDHKFWGIELKEGSASGKYYCVFATGYNIEEGNFFIMAKTKKEIRKLHDKLVKTEKFNSKAVKKVAVFREDFVQRMPR